MCKVADAAMTMVNKSIELAKTNESFYMDFVKLHKLLYLAQCRMLEQYGRTMFDERITARQCGPYIEGLHFIPSKRDFGEIKIPFSDNEFVQPSYRRMKVIEQVLEEFGKLSTDELIQYTKESPAYRAVEDKIEEHVSPEISPELICQSMILCVG